MPSCSGETSSPSESRHERRAHREVFAGIDPVATCVEVRALVLPELLVEIEVDAIVDLP